MSALPGHRRGCVCPACLGAAVSELDAALGAFVTALATAFVEDVRTSWLGDAVRWMRGRR